MNSVQQAHSGVRHQVQTYLGLLAVALLSLLAIIAYFLWSGHREAEHDSEITTQNLALTLESRLQGTLARVDAVLDELANDAMPMLMQKSALAGRHSRDKSKRGRMRWRSCGQQVFLCAATAVERKICRC
jgi:hypothetical protein